MKFHVEWVQKDHHWLASCDRFQATTAVGYTPHAAIKHLDEKLQRLRKNSDDPAHVAHDIALELRERSVYAGIAYAEERIRRTLKTERDAILAIVADVYASVCAPESGTANPYYVEGWMKRQISLIESRIKERK